MNSVLEKNKWIKYALGAFVIALGILIIVLACLDLTKLEDAITIVISVALLILGLASLIITIFSETHKGFTYSLLISSLIISAGIILLIGRFSVHFNIEHILLVYTLSIITLVFGVACLFKGVSLIVYKEKKPLIAALFAVAVVAITLGILGIVFAKDLGGVVVAGFVIRCVLVLFACFVLKFLSEPNHMYKVRI